MLPSDVGEEKKPTKSDDEEFGFVPLSVGLGRRGARANFCRHVNKSEY